MGAMLVGTCFALLLSILRLLSTHPQYPDLTDRYALRCFVYALPEQVHRDLLGAMIIFGFGVWRFRRQFQ